MHASKEDTTTNISLVRRKIKVGFRLDLTYPIYMYDERCYPMVTWGYLFGNALEKMRTVP